MTKSRLPLSRTPQKICILRLSALGDVSHTLPVIRLIQKNWPDTEITWICGKFEHRFLQLIEGVRFVVFDKKAGLKEYFKLWRTLKHERFDVLMQMQVAARANIASLGIKADIRLGWDKSRSRDLHQLFINHRIPTAPQQHQVDGFLSFASTLGLDASKTEWNIPITDDAKEFANQYVDSDKQVLIISACSSHALRNWQPDRYAAVADYAIEKYNMQVVLSGGPSPIEVTMASQIEQYMQQTPLNLVGKDTLEQLIGLLARADIVISPDSGPAHLANALGVPVIGLYACTWSRRSGPSQSLQLCVDKFEQAAMQFRNKPADQLAWGTRIEQPGVMELISIDEVKAQLDQVMTSSSKN